MTQILIAVCIYLLLVYLKYPSKIGALQQILLLLQLNLYERRDLQALLRVDPTQPDVLTL
jgi:putative transposase